jgi:hypothetical protein
MKKLIHAILTLWAMIRSAVSDAFFRFSIRCYSRLAGCRGDLATNTIGAIIVAVVIIGLLITAVKGFFPGFFNSMFTSMRTKLNGYW